MKKKTLLIIDDFIPLLEEVAQYLSFEGYNTFSAKDGSEGIQMAIQHKPDLIICDIEMPKMNGYEVLKTLEKIPLTASIPFIFLTAKAQADDYKVGLQLGADDYITKPLELDTLLMSISKRLDKHEKLKEKHQAKFDIMIKNPLIGTFIFIEDQFVMVNKKFEEVSGYSKNDLNKQQLSKLLLGDKETILSKLNSCLKNIHDKLQLKISFLNNNKKVVFVELFAKYVELDSKNALIGSIIDVGNSVKSDIKMSYTDKPTEEFEKIIKYLVSIGKDNVAEEVINVKELIAFDLNQNLQKVHQKVGLTRREKEILKFICEGFTNIEIAEKLFISNRTVDNHRANLLAKTATKNTAALVAFSVKNHIVEV